MITLSKIIFGVGCIVSLIGLLGAMGSLQSCENGNEMPKVMEESEFSKKPNSEHIAVKTAITPESLRLALHSFLNSPTYKLDDIQVAKSRYILYFALNEEPEEIQATFSKFSDLERFKFVSAIATKIIMSENKYGCASGFNYYVYEKIYGSDGMFDGMFISLVATMREGLALLIIAFLLILPSLFKNFSLY